MWLIKSTHFWLATTTTIDNVGFLFLFQFRLVETRWTHIINRRTRIAYNRCIESSCTVWLEFFHFWFSSVVRRYSHVSHDLYAKFRLNLSSHLIVCVGIFFLLLRFKRRENSSHLCSVSVFITISFWCELRNTFMDWFQFDSINRSEYFRGHTYGGTVP